MQYCVDHPEEISKLAKVKAQVSEVKGVMMENIEKVVCSGLSVSLVFIRLFATILFAPTALRCGAYLFFHSFLF